MKSKIPFIILLVCLLFVASCKEDKYCSVSTSISPDNSGIVYPESGIYEKGTTITLTAEPSEGYIFVGWGGDASGNDNPMIVDVHSDMDIIALFNLKSYPLSITMVGEGVVNEEVISSKSDYGHGTLVELTAMPAEGWSFSHWEGDIESDANPYQIEINSTTSVKAVFEKRVFSFSVKTVGPGCVDEYLIETKAQFEYGTKIRLEVIPFNGAVFKGWSGAVSGIETSKIVDIHSSEEIVATFSWEVSKYPIPEDLRIPSVMLKRFYSDTFTSKLCTFSGNILTFDYNQDGYPDVVTSFENGELLSPIRFYLGQEDGTIIPDPINDRKILGLDECRKLIYGDYNGDGKPDICIISHGIDVFPFPGDYPMVLLSQEDGSFKDVRFPEYIGYYHGGTAGDFDNDGDVDILFSDSSDRNNIILVNDGEGNFTPTFGLFPSVYEKFTAEWYDIDKDGYLDLIWSLPGEVIWGNGISFVDNESSTTMTAILCWISTFTT